VTGRENFFRGRPPLGKRSAAANTEHLMANNDKKPHSTTHAELHARWMKDPEYRKAYEEETERERLAEEAKKKKGV